MNQTLVEQWLRHHILGEPEPQEDNPMYEKFTDRARKAMTQANFEANHYGLGKEIEPMHILLGIVGLHDGVAFTVMSDMRVEMTEKELRDTFQCGQGGAPIIVLPKSKQSQMVIEAAISSARSLGHNYVGTEHLLLGLLAVNSTAKDFLNAKGLTACRVEKQVLAVLGQQPPRNSPASDTAKGRVEAGEAVYQNPDGTASAKPREKLAVEEQLRRDGYEKVSGDNPYWKKRSPHGGIKDIVEGPKPSFADIGALSAQINKEAFRAAAGGIENSAIGPILKELAAGNAKPWLAALASLGSSFEAAGIEIEPMKGAAHTDPLRVPAKVTIRFNSFPG